MGKPPPRGRHGPGCRPRAAKGKGAGTGTAADAGTRRRAQGRAAEAGGWRVRVRATPRWAVLRIGRGGGERVKREGFNEERLRMGRRQERGGETNDPEMTEEKVGWKD